MNKPRWTKHVYGFRDKVDDQVWRFLLTGGVALENPYPNPCTEWLSEKAWSEIVRASDLPNLKGLKDSEYLGPLHNQLKQLTACKFIYSGKVCVILLQRNKKASSHTQGTAPVSVLFILPGFPDPGWKVFYDSATPNSERMPDPWDAVSGLDRWVWTNHFPPCEIQTVYKSYNIC